MSEEIQNRMMTGENTETRGAPIAPRQAGPMNEGAPGPSAGSRVRCASDIFP